MAKCHAFLINTLHKNDKNANEEQWHGTNSEKQVKINWN